MASVRIVDEYEALSMDPARVGKFDVVVAYSVDGASPRFMFFPKESYSADAAIRSIQDRERKRSQIVGRTVQL